MTVPVMIDAEALFRQTDAYKEALLKVQPIVDKLCIDADWNPYKNWNYQFVYVCFASDDGLPTELPTSKIKVTDFLCRLVMTRSDRPLHVVRIKRTDQAAHVIDFEWFGNSETPPESRKVLDLLSKPNVAQWINKHRGWFCQHMPEVKISNALFAAVSDALGGIAYILPDGRYVTRSEYLKCDTLFELRQHKGKVSERVYDLNYELLPKSEQEHDVAHVDRCVAKYNELRASLRLSN